MKTKISILLIINFVLSCFAQSDDFKYKKLIYDENLSNLNIVNIPFGGKCDYQILNHKLNLFLNENNKSKIDKINFDDYTFLPKHLRSQYVKSDFVGFCFGTKKVFNNNLIIYSEDFEDNSLKNKHGIFLTTGLVLIENEGFIRGWIKVFEADIDSETSLESFIFDNYIILVQTIDPGYDVFYIGSRSKVRYKYLVFRVQKGGVVQKLNKVESEIVKKKYLIRIH